RGRCNDRAVRRFCHRLHHAGVVVRSVGARASGCCAGSGARARSVLDRSRPGWFRILGPLWSSDRRHHDSSSIPEAAPEVAGHLRDRARRHRRIELVELDRPESAVPCSLDTISGFRVVDRRRLRAPDDYRTCRARNNGPDRPRQGRMSLPATMNVLAWITAANAALFMFGAMQHAGVAVGPFREPRIVPAAVVEAICGAALAYAAATLFRRTPAARR